MKIKVQTRKLAAGCSKHCFEVVDRTDEVSNIYTVRRRWRGLKRFSKSISQSRALELIWLGGFVAFALHLLLHIGQSILLRKYIPALITSILCFPISAYLITDIVHLWQVSTSEFFLFSLVSSGIVVINLLFALWLGEKYSTWLVHKNKNHCLSQINLRKAVIQFLGIRNDTQWKSKSKLGS